jgi:hypothetical protein
MRDLRQLDQYRDRAFERKHYGQNGGATEGVFRLRLRRRDGHKGAMLAVIASCGEGWEHVSVSTSTRCPTWDEMEYVKRLFFEDDETVVQYHVPVSEHINLHPFVLHLWRPVGLAIPRPPGWMVG